MWRGPSTRRGYQGDAAPVRIGVETSFEQLSGHGVDEPLEQGMVQPADQLGVADSEAVERTVHHDHVVIGPARLIAMVREDAYGEIESRIGLGRMIS
jgi:hypothetical protein